jgi:hypothetical protein
MTDIRSILQEINRRKKKKEHNLFYYRMIDMDQIKELRKFGYNVAPTKMGFFISWKRVVA